MPIPAGPPSHRRLGDRWFYLALAGILIFGATVRICLTTSFTPLGVDENFYMAYVSMTHDLGLQAYPEIAERYIVEQSRNAGAILPPTRFLYIFCSYLWSEIFGASPREAVRAVSCLFSILTLVLSAVWSWRTGGRSACLGVTALMACGAVEIHLSQHGMIDGFFAFWALLSLWSLWECLQNPGSIRWQIVYGAALALMVLTKENAFFVYVALCGVLVLNLKLRFGTATRQLLLVMLAGPTAGVVVLLFLAGGVENVVHIYGLLVAKAYTLDYAIKTGDGPWHRYLVDLLLTSPLVLLLATGSAFRVRLGDKFYLYLLGFFAVSYAFMCNVKYGMNLRYATVWDLPLRYLAFAQLLVWSRSVGRYRTWFLIGTTAFVCAYELRQYHIFFVEHPLYELASGGLLRALNILK